LISFQQGTDDAMAVETDLLPPRYRGLKRIGRGAMGEIYRATDTTLGRAVAIKVLAHRYAEDEGVRERFTREALAAARLSGAPHIVTIFDVGEWNDRPFIVMEYLSGGSLDDRLHREGVQPPGRVLEWVAQAGRALDAAHSTGVVHRDVKPANLLLDRDENVHVADFGIASAAGMDSLTQTGTVLGTAGYLSPEQAQGARATAASDRYALGVVAWELLTGSRPFQAETMTAEAAAHVHRPVPSVCDRNAELPCEFDPVFERALAKDPAARFPTCADFVADLRAALDEAAGATRVFTSPPATAVTERADGRRPPPAPRSRARSRWLWPLLALLAVSAIVGGVLGAVLSGGGGSESASPPQASVRTITQQGTTVHETVTTPASAPASAPTTQQRPTTQAAAADAHSLNDRGYALMRQGDYEAALPLLQQAVQGLQGVGPSDPYEGYANYNLGYSLLQVGRCSDAVPYLERAKQLEPERHEPKEALKQAQKC
jgi:eukaryotic-like serine/threonine-protein kinase